MRETLRYLLPLFLKNKSEILAESEWVKQKCRKSVNDHHSSLRWFCLYRTAGRALIWNFWKICNFLIYRINMPIRPGVQKQLMNVYILANNTIRCEGSQSSDGRCFESLRRNFRFFSNFLYPDKIHMVLIWGKKREILMGIGVRGQGSRFVQKFWR